MEPTSSVWNWHCLVNSTSRQSCVFEYKCGSTRGTCWPDTTNVVIRGLLLKTRVLHSVDNYRSCFFLQNWTGACHQNPATSRFTTCLEVSVHFCLSRCLLVSHLQSTCWYATQTFSLSDISSIRARYLVHTLRLLFIFFRFFHRKKENCVYLHLKSPSAYDVK